MTVLVSMVAVGNTRGWSSASADCHHCHCSNDLGCWDNDDYDSNNDDNDDDDDSLMMASHGSWFW